MLRSVLKDVWRELTLLRTGHSAPWRREGSYNAQTSGGSYNAQTSDVSFNAPANTWTVKGVGNFKHSETFTFENGKIPDGLRVSDYRVIKGTAPFDYWNRQQNTYVGEDGFLNLLVPGSQRPENQDNLAYTAEIATVEDQIKYASVRTLAVLSKVPGVCCGMFFYKSDNQEIDIEYLTDPASLSNPQDGQPPVMLYTNQSSQPGGQTSQASGRAPAHIGLEHEYRIDWIPGACRFYVDGKLQASLDSNVPTVPGQWMWNNWCNGDKGFTCGPPTDDSFFKIKKIEMYYNTGSEDFEGAP